MICPSNDPLSSFFDDRQITEKFWRRPNQSEQLLDPKKMRCMGIFFKTVKKASSLKKLFVYAGNEFLCVTTEEKSLNVHKIMWYDCVRLNFVQVSEPFLMNKLVFSKNRQRKELITEDEQTFEVFKKFLSSKCILSTFHEEFEVKKMIGKGSFAKVYLANHKETNEEFAIKAFNKEFLLSQNKGQESLINEIAIMRRISHRNVLKLYEVYETKHSIYLVLEVITGGELIKKIKEKAIYNEIDIARIMKNFLLALEHIHEQGIMHRDLKPENLLLRNEGDYFDLVIADFGLAAFKYEENSKILFKRCGTPGFVAPEVLLYKDGQEGFYDEKCDVFSAGVIFYLLLTGRKLFVGADYKQILRANKSCQIDFQMPFLKSLPPTTIDLLKKMLLAFPQARISASRALIHPYFNILASDQETITKGDEYPKHLQIVKENLAEYCVLIDQDQIFSKDSLGSFITTQRPLLNGRIETIERLNFLSNSNASMDISQSLSPVRRITSSKFSAPPAAGENFPNIAGEESPLRFGMKKKSVDGLHRQAIINSLAKNGERREEERKNEGE